MDTTASTRNRKWILVVLFFALLFRVVWYSIFSAPTGQTGPVTIHVVRNESVSQIAQELQEKNVITYPIVLKSFVTFFKSDKQIARGDYLFTQGESVYSVAWQVASSHHGVLPLKITLKEGITDVQIADLLGAQLPDFNRTDFLGDPRVKQGYLFPDTYFFFPLTTTEEVIGELTSNFNNKIGSLKSDISASHRSESDSIIMASILQKEAFGKDDAPTIAGILWKRVGLGMPLQVDAAPITYAERGLPQQPIGNPGLVSIEAALRPVDSPYLFYLHDKNGMVHYATTFAEHKANIARYLK